MRHEPSPTCPDADCIPIVLSIGNEPTVAYSIGTEIIISGQTVLVTATSHISILYACFF